MKRTKKTKPDIYPGAPISTDVSGSYTGRPRDPADRPVQDADDL